MSELKKSIQSLQKSVDQWKKGKREKDIQLLQESIEHWQKDNVEQENPGLLSTYYCPLCGEYFYQKVFCYGCPVSEFSGEPGCYGTPWQDAYDAKQSHGPTSPQFIDASKAEVEFLKKVKRGLEDDSE